MRFVLDNCVNRNALAFFGSFEVQHCIDLGWDQLSNGELLASASGNFDVLVTVDKNMQFQSNLKGLQICVTVLDVKGNFPDELQAAIQRLLANLEVLKEGEFVVIEP